MNTIKLNSESITPSKIVCVGRNYVEHIKELGNEEPTQMILFNKPNSAISESLKFFSNDTRFEGEICFLIQNKEIAAIGFGLDLTKANEQIYLKNNGHPWERSKSFNGSAIFSDFIFFDGNIENIRMELFINGVLKQFGSISLMIHKPQNIINEIENFMSLEDNDIIMSGTPKGVNTYKEGDVFVGKIFQDNTLLIEKKWEVQS